ncbi:sensor histidine kinase KdpD [Winogradskyella sp.]|uniref:sensor histidine kinase n=1 Tax=Winogradskyella sp. TaxID=1883156 RepID=UPI00260F443F|nr:HAMP domain-containing sensor histidine kinase [Winogradskyella sp.]
MNDKRYQWILYTIVAVIVVTIGIQVFWNYKNYQANKQQLINDVQVSLDKAVDDYYADLAERTTLGVSLVGENQLDAFGEDSELAKFLEKIDKTTAEFNNLDSLEVDNLEGITVVRGRKADSMMADYRERHKPISADSFKLKVDEFKLNDSIDLKNISMLTSKVFISISNDTLDVKVVDSILKNELNRKNIDLKSKLTFYESDRFNRFSKKRDSIISETNPDSQYTLSTTSKSTFLPKGSTLKVDFTNETATVLKRSLSGVLISTVLVLAVISCLFYLLKIIKHQKQLAEVKNDLISNITHEFKTPIATIGVALESISSFNGIDDKEKTKKYINMSSEQLNKLNIMVEKLLETATLDSDSLELNKEGIDIVALLNDLANRFKIQYPEKEFNISLKVENLEAKVDLFHFENALNNILDNAVKYGGHIISVDLIPKQNSFDILISDSGNTLSKVNKDRIFEKFYRVPKGNTHDVKGFGIGLYYTKTIIEKHGGSIDLNLTKNLTTFKITLPNDR